MKLFAVIGNPVAHSRSPEIHQAFAAQTGIVLEYQRLEAPVTPDDSGFEKAAHAFFASGGVGMNVTAPFKDAAFRLACDASERALLAGAANTLTNNGCGGWHADNTDGVGLVRDVSRNATGRRQLAGQRLLILGAGGATAGILAPLLDTHPSQVVVWNRTLEKAQRLVHRFAEVYPDVPLLPSDKPCDQWAFDHGSRASPAVYGGETHPPAFDLIVHATSLRGAQGEALAAETWPWLNRLCTPDSFFYDLGYADDGITPFLRWARKCGARRWADGLGMLVEQAAESFRGWHGCLPETAPVLAALRPSK